MKILGKVLKCLKNSKCIQSKGQSIISKSESIFSNAQNCTTRPKEIPVSLEEIEILNSRGVVPIKYTTKDILTIIGRKMFAPIKAIYNAGSYMFAKAFKNQTIEPRVRITEAELPDCLKGVL